MKENDRGEQNDNEEAEPEKNHKEIEQKLEKTLEPTFAKIKIPRLKLLLFGAKLRYACEKFLGKKKSLKFWFSRCCNQ